MQKKYIPGLLAVLLVTVNACGKKDEAPSSPSVPTSPSTSAQGSPAATSVSVDTITLGNAIGAGKKVSQAADSFGKNDTIYASVDTTGAGSATLKAKWTYRMSGQESVVKEDSQTITPTGPASSEFHISKPDGWPTGDYKVEIFVADKAAGSKTFTVK
jgi:hypothetical protein